MQRAETQVLQEKAAGSGGIEGVERHMLEQAQALSSHYILTEAATTHTSPMYGCEIGNERELCHILSVWLANVSTSPFG